MQQILPQVYLKYKAVAINFLRVLWKVRVYQNRTVHVSETNIFVYYWRLRNCKSLKWQFGMCLTITERKFSYEVLSEAGRYLYAGQFFENLKLFTW
jgi:hypothetical protein